MSGFSTGISPARSGLDSMYCFQPCRSFETVAKMPSASSAVFTVEIQN